MVEDLHTAIFYSQNQTRPLHPVCQQRRDICLLPRQAHLFRAIKTLLHLAGAKTLCTKAARPTGYCELFTVNQ